VCWCAALCERVRACKALVTHPTRAPVGRQSLAALLVAPDQACRRRLQTGTPDCAGQGRHTHASRGASTPWHDTTAWRLAHAILTFRWQSKRTPFRTSPHGRQWRARRCSIASAGRSVLALAPGSGG
jgi:hypothetical protein